MNKKQRNKGRNRRNKAIVDSSRQSLDGLVKDFQEFFIEQPQNCRSCGTCCKVFDIYVGEEDMVREPKLREICVPIGDTDKGVFEEDLTLNYVMDKDFLEPCSFHSKYGCSIHSTKPKVCSGFIPSHHNCLKSVLNEVKFLLAEWVTEAAFDFWLETPISSFLLEAGASYETQFVYFMIYPYLIGLDKVKKYCKNQIGLSAGVLGVLLDLDREIPEPVREYLSLSDEYKIIAHLFMKPVDYQPREK